MREPDLAVVEQAFGAGRGQGGRDIDDIDIGEGVGEFGQRDIGEAEAGAVAPDAALGEAQRLHRRLGQIVDQDRRGRHARAVRSGAAWRGRYRPRGG